MCSPVQSISNRRIALLACYFGDLPPYAGLVFRTMGMNSELDWFFITDRTPNFDLPANVHLRIRSLKSVADRCAEICGFPIEIHAPYDICSLRPVFGLCFAEYLGGYGFWGHVDMDVIYGDILSFLPNSVLDSHDRILCRGHLSIYRNNHTVNHAFMLPTPGGMDYRKTFKNLSTRPFLDEWQGIWKIMRYHRFHQYHDEFIADIRPPSRYRIGRFEAEELPNHRHQIFYWHGGKTFQAYYHREGGLFDREVAYIHFQKRTLPAPSFNQKAVSGFSINNSGFLPYDRENLTPTEMDILNHDRLKPFGLIVSESIGRVKRKLSTATKTLDSVRA